MSDDTLINLFNLPREQFELLCAKVDGKPYRAHQMMKWAYHHRELDFARMTNLSKAFRTWLSEHAEFKPPEIVERLDSVDGTIKWVVRAMSLMRPVILKLPASSRMARSPVCSQPSSSIAAAVASASL